VDAIAALVAPMKLDIRTDIWTAGNQQGEPERRRHLRRPIKLFRVTLYVSPIPRFIASNLFLFPKIQNVFLKKTLCLAIPLMMPFPQPSLT
jgi:hypothetical protein